MSYKRTYAPPTSLGATRYGAGTSLGSSYLSSLGRNRSSTRDGSGSDYGGRSGYSSGTGSRSYDIPGRQSGVYKGVNSLASKFGGTVTAPKTSVPDTQTPSSSRFSVDRKAPVEDLKLARPQTLNVSPAYTSIYPKRTSAEPSTKLDTNSSVSSKPKSYTRNETTGNVSGNVSDALSGHGSDYLSGYNSSSRYNPSSYRRSNSHLNATSPTYGRQSYGRDSDSYKSVYSRQNSGVFDSGDSSSWRSKVYGNNNAKTEKPNNESTVFNDAIQKLTKSGKEDTIGGKKLPDGVSPNAIKVLPILSPGDIKLKKNKAPADFTSASEDSDDERNSNLSPTSKSRNGKPTVTVSSPSNPPPPPARAFRHLSAVSALPSLSTSSNNSGLAQLPKLKLSSKYATQNTETVTTMPATTSKWLNKDTNSSNTSNDHSKVSNNGTAGNKDCRKSVLNMNLEPENKESMRKQQEEKREELRRLRKRNTENDTSTNRNSLYDNVDGGNNNNITEEKTDKSETVTRRLSPLSPFIQKSGSKSKLIPKTGSGGKLNVRKRLSPNSKQLSISTNSSTSSSSDDDSQTVNVTVQLRRRRRSRDLLSNSPIENGSSPRVRTISQRSRNSSESLSKNNSKSDISVPRNSSITNISVQNVPRISSKTDLTKNSSMSTQKNNVIKSINEKKSIS